MKSKLALCLALATVHAACASAQPPALGEAISAREAETWEMARKIWDYAEPGYQEKKSASLLADALETAGFTVARGRATFRLPLPPLSVRASRCSASWVNTMPCPAWARMPCLSGSRAAQRLRSWLRAPSLRRCRVVGHSCACRPDQSGPHPGNAALLRLSRGGRRQCPCLHGTRRFVQGLRRGLALAPQHREPRERPFQPGAHCRQVPFSRD